MPRSANRRSSSRSDTARLSKPGSVMMEWRTKSTVLRTIQFASHFGTAKQFRKSSIQRTPLSYSRTMSAWSSLKKSPASTLKTGSKLMERTTSGAVGIRKDLSWRNRAYPRITAAIGGKGKMVDCSWLMVDGLNRIFVPLESGGGCGGCFSTQVVGFSCGAEGIGEKWPNSHIFPPFLTSSMWEFLVRVGSLWLGVARYRSVKKGRKSAIARIRSIARELCLWSSPNLRGFI